MKIREIIRTGVVVKSDYGLYTGDDGVVLLSIYGAPQQVQSISAAVLGGKTVTNTTDRVGLHRLRNANYSMRMKSRSIGYGKRQALLWSEEAVAQSIIWMKESDMESSVEAFMSQRKVPYEREYFPLFKERLIADGSMETLFGWGDIQGLSLYEENDDRLCDLMLEIVESSLSEGNTKEGGIRYEKREYIAESHP